jgi:putative transposase
MRFQFIDDHRDEFPLTRMCKVLKVSRSRYYAWRTRPVSEQEMANRELAKKPEAVYNESDGTYSSPRIHSELTVQGVVCGKNRIARLMMLLGLFAKQHKRYRATTKRNRAHRAAPNLLKGNFTTEHPNQIWLSDIIYIPTQEGWLYLAAVLDLYARCIVGWVIADQMTSDLTLTALRMALRQRQPRLALLQPLRSGQPVHRW